MNKKIILIFLIIINFLLLIYSTISIIKWRKDSNNTNEVIEKYNVEINESNNGYVVTSEDNNINDPYLKYINMSLINVNFNELKQINDQTKGWIQVNGTNINYPFVQSNDNSFYLNHSFDKSYNGAGWIFEDYRVNNNSKHIIIYGHRRSDLTMFGTLKNILTSDWQNNIENHVVKLSTESENTLWQVFSVYHIKTTSDYLKVEFNNDFEDFANMLIDRSAYNFNTSVNENDRILTLSSCYGNDEKVVLHAKLIKIEKR